MTKDEILKIAEQSGLFVFNTKIYSPHPIGEDDELNEYIFDLVKISIVHERELCAKVCESLFDADDDSCNEAEMCAAAIRARSNNAT